MTTGYRPQTASETIARIEAGVDPWIAYRDFRLCERDGLPIPAWTQDPGYRLSELWYLYEGAARMRDWLHETTHVRSPSATSGAAIVFCDGPERALVPRRQGRSRAAGRESSCGIAARRPPALNSAANPGAPRTAAADASASAMIGRGSAKVAAVMRNVVAERSRNAGPVSVSVTIGRP
jgi:hypothetical protein